MRRTKEDGRSLLQRTANSLDVDDRGRLAFSRPESVVASPRNPFGLRFVIPVYVAVALNPINSAVIATALVSIAAALHVPVASTAILISSLYLTCAIAQPTAGRLAEQCGPRRVFLAGIAIVLIGGLVGAFATDLGVLVVARVLIGLGTSAGYPTAMLLIRRRARAAGMQSPPANVLAGLAIAGAATLAVGPTVGGMLVGWFDWRAAFWTNVPVAIAALFMAVRWIAPDPPREEALPVKKVLAQIDPFGVVAFAVTLTALLVFLMYLPTVRWSALAVALIGAVCLTWYERRSTNPFFDVALLTEQPGLARTYGRHGLSQLGTYVILYGLTQWLELAHGYSAYQAGLLLIPLGAASGIGAWVCSQRQRVRIPLIAAGLLQVVAAVIAVFLDGSTPAAEIVVIAALVGASSGSAVVLNQTALYQEAPAETVGTAAGLMRTFGYVGSIISATITGIVFHTRVDDSGLHRVSLMLVGVGLAVIVLTLCGRKKEGAMESCDLSSLEPDV